MVETGDVRLRLDDGARDAPRIAFLAVFEDHVGQVLLVHMSNQVRCRLPLRPIHPHVERLVATETEATALAVELHRGNAEIGQRPRNSVDASGVQHFFELSIIRVHQLDAITHGCERRTRDRQCLGVAIQPEDARRAGIDQRTCVTAEPDRAIDEKPTP